MKRTIILSVLGIVLLAGVVVLANHRSASVAGTSPTPTTQAAYRLIVIADTVSLNGKTVHGTVTVKVGDRVTTSTTGRARLSWPNGTTTTLENDSQITIKALADGGSQSRIELIFGDIWSKVTRILGAGQYYEVETQDTVAAVRGTIFRTTYRNQISRVQGIEHVVHVSQRRTDGTTDDSNSVDVQEKTEVNVDHREPKQRFSTRRLTDTELRDKVYDHIKRERDLDDEHVRPTPSPTVRPSATPKVSILPTLKPTPTPTPTPSATVEPTATPIPDVILDHVFPKVVANGETFSLEGKNFSAGRNVSRISSVSVGGKAAADFSVIMGGTDIFVTPPQLSAGIYDVGVVTTDGVSVILKDAVTIQ